MPGCYPTTATLALLPAITHGLTDARDVVIVAASGPSGAGRALKPHLLGAELMGSASAYGVGGVHRHTPELLQNFTACGAEQPSVSFTPVLVPMSRGILATCTAPLRDPGLTPEQAYAAYAEAYADEPFVHLLPPGQWPQTQSVLGANAVHVQVAVDARGGPAGRGGRPRQPDQGHRRRGGAVHEPRPRLAGDDRPAAGGSGAVTCRWGS